MLLLDGVLHILVASPVFRVEAAPSPSKGCHSAELSQSLDSGDRRRAFSHSTSGFKAHYFHDVVSLAMSSDAIRRGWGESTDGMRRKVLRRHLKLDFSQKLF